MFGSRNESIKEMLQEYQKEEIVEAKKIGYSFVRYRLDDGKVRYRYHHTDVVTVAHTSPEGSDWIQFKTDGWETPTTKNKMLQALSELNLDMDFGLFQEKHVWYISVIGYDEPFTFHDGVEFIRTDDGWIRFNRPRAKGLDLQMVMSA